MTLERHVDVMSCLYENLLPYRRIPRQLSSFTWNSILYVSVHFACKSFELSTNVPQIQSAKWSTNHRVFSLCWMDYSFLSVTQLP